MKPSLFNFLKENVEIPVKNDLDAVTGVANALVYQGLDENVAVQLVGSLTDAQCKLLIFTLVKMISIFHGLRH